MGKFRAATKSCLCSQGSGKVVCLWEIAGSFQGASIFNNDRIVVEVRRDARPFHVRNIQSIVNDGMDLGRAKSKFSRSSWSNADFTHFRAMMSVSRLDGRGERQWRQPPGFPSMSQKTLTDVLLRCKGYRLSIDLLFLVK